MRAACQNEEGVITTYATIRYADHIHKLITASDGHNDRLQSLTLHNSDARVTLFWQFFFVTVFFAVIFLGQFFVLQFCSLG